MKSAGLLLGVALAASGCATSGGGGGTTASGGGGGDVPAISIDDVDGNTHQLSDHIGNNKVVVVSFWATWCKPCIKELGVLQSLYEEHKSEGLEVLAVSIDEPETRAQVRPFAKQSGFTFPVLIDADWQMVQSYNPSKKAPYMLVFDRSGKQVYEHGTYQPSDEPALRNEILSLVQKGGGGS